MCVDTAILESKTIDELCFGKDRKRYLFHIPTYQRGYRWDEHVIKLIEDLLEYKLAKDLQKNVGDYYCLQPIIVKRYEKLDTENEVCFEVVDGQQRLITIFILLKVFGYTKKSFAISFERDSEDKEREKYLIQIKHTPEENNVKADFYFMKNALSLATKWLEQKSEELSTMSLDDIMRSVLMQNTRVIWYELAGLSSGRDVFRNINYGKLPLTNSELIKAMMLNSKHYSPHSGEVETRDRMVRIEQERMARLWDEIERTLQDEDFWAFISGTEKYSTRIDYIFDLIYYENTYDKKINLIDVFSYFERRLTDENEDALKQIDSLWNDIRLYYRTFQDWFSDIKLYNYIGYLVHYNFYEVTSIKQEFEKNTKAEFLTWLSNAIKRNLKVQNLAELTYDEDRQKIEKLLLLFNIKTANNMGRRFNFVIDGAWSVEHVTAKRSIKIADKDKNDWIEKYLPVIKSAIKTARKEDLDPLIELENSMRNYLSQKTDDFDALFEKIIALVECKGVEVESINNLALIGSINNSRLNNSAFYEKRQMIIEMEEQGHNIPQATIHLFMKFYSGIGTNLDYWSADDGKAYLQRLKSLLKVFCMEEDTADDV